MEESACTHPVDPVSNGLCKTVHEENDMHAVEICIIDILFLRRKKIRQIKLTLLWATEQLRYICLWMGSEGHAVLLKLAVGIIVLR